MTTIMRVLALALLAVLLLHCEKGSPVLEEGVVLSISAEPNTVLNFGDTAVVRVRAFEADGRPVLDGARIQLIASAGTISGEVRTEDGLATGIFTSPASAGTVTLTAQSGSLAGDGSVSTTIEVLDRDVAVSAASLTANPSNLSAVGGQVSLRLVVFGPDNEPLQDKAVVFSSDFGSLANNGTIVYTDGSGLAFDTLSLSAIPESVSAVTVTATAGSLSQTATVTITTNQTPTAVMVISPEAPTEGETVFFNGETSTDTDGTLSSWFWDLGDGTQAMGPTVSHVYAQSRDYTIILRVTDNQGASSSITQLLSIGSNQAPEADFTVSNSNPRINEPVVFDGRSSRDPDGSVTAYEWSLGNGVTRSGATTTYAYPGAQDYTVTLVVTDNSGATAVSQKQVSVSGNILPVADFVVSPLSPKVGETVNFFAAPSSDEDGFIEDYRWEFGDFNTDRGSSVTHIYQAVGTYEVLLAVTDNDGGTAYFTQQLTISDNSAPIASFSVQPDGPNVGQTVFFDASASSDNDGQIASYRWEFGDGTFGSGLQVSHVYTQSGDYQVALVVQDNEGRENVASQVVRVANGAVPLAVLRADPDTLAPPGGYVLLDGSGSSDGEDNLSALTFAFEISKPNHVQVSLAGGDRPLRQAEISNLAEGDRVAFLMHVTDSDGNQSSATATIIGSTSEENSVPNAELGLTPISLLPPGGSVVLDGSASSDSDHTFGELGFAYSAQTTGEVNVTIEGSGPIRTAVISDAVAGDSVTFRLNVTDPLGGQGVVYKLLSISETLPNNPPNAVLLSTPANSTPQPASGPIHVVLDASGSSDMQDALTALTFDFVANVPDGVTVVWDDSVTVPYLAVADLFGAASGDNLVFSVTVTDTSGDEDFDFVTINVTNPAKR